VKQVLMIRITFLTLVMVLLCGCTLSGIDIEQEEATGLAGELLDSHSYGQTFELQNNGLYRIDLYTATYARENTHPVIFHILNSPSAGGGQDLVRLEIPADQISNSGPTVITFPLLSETAGKSLYFFIESPGAVPGDAITVYRNDKDVYPDGQMFVDGQPADGDLAFIAYTQETFTAGDIWNDFYSRASQDKTFFTFYCSLLVLVLLALSGVLIWSTRKSIPGKKNDLEHKTAGSSEQIGEEQD
jgi:hypothetical protein